MITAASGNMGFKHSIFLTLLIHLVQQYDTKAAFAPTNCKHNKRRLTLKHLDSTKYKHTAAILTFPRTSRDQIANEEILLKAMEHTNERLSVVIRCKDGLAHRTPIENLRRYVGEVYSLAWDCCAGNNGDLLDIIVYPQSLPNAAPEQWIYHRPELECICGADEMLGWYSQSSKINKEDETKASIYVAKDGHGSGGLMAHCEAVNDDRISRKLSPLMPLKVDISRGADVSLKEEVRFLEDLDISCTSTDESSDSSLGILGGSRLDDNLFDSVAVGGTFDGLHYGHRKLLTLAVSSVNVAPSEGKLLIGITSDEMLRNKKFAEYITPVEERIRELNDFIGNLAPGIKNRVKVEVINDAFGPTATEEHFTALVLSHETLENGLLLNEVRREKGFPPLTLLCTRRTEANAMSSTALRYMRAESEVKGNI